MESPFVWKMDPVSLLIISCSENSIYFQNSVPFQQLIRAWTKLSVSFINRMKKSLNELTPFSVESSSIQQRSSETSSLNQFWEQGWTLPMRQNFRFSSKQRKNFYILSMVKHQEKNLVLSKYLCQFGIN